MSGDDEKQRKTVGVYERPAGADRGNRVLWILLALFVAAASAVYFFG